MKKKKLFNKIDKVILKNNLENEKFNRITASFYKYVPISKPEEFRDNLFLLFDEMLIFGRIYVSKEGVNAQLSIPQKNWDLFLLTINKTKEIRNVDIKKALIEGISFYKLTIRVRKELVAYGLNNNEYDMNRVGKHLNSADYNTVIQNNKTIVVDMRNYYESEVGRFDNAIIPDVETSKELLPEVKNMLKGKEDEKILLYCTGGIRCEKASSYLIKNGFKDINQLQGGIIQYAHDMKQKSLESKFKGKNFVFDNRLGERVTKDIISKCHICESSCDTHTDCKNDACNILFIQCKSCDKKYNGCCSADCKHFASLTLEKRKELRKTPEHIVSKTFFDSRIKPKLRP